VKNVYTYHPVIKTLIAVLLFCSCSSVHNSQNLRSDVLLEQWLFALGEYPESISPEYQSDIAGDTSNRWQSVVVPHDWAIYGPFDKKNDLQQVAVSQNLEKTASLKTGRTGGLPYVGIGWYRTTFDVEGFNAENKSVSILFDGAMSEAQVYLNGKKVCEWPYGYNSFYCNVTKYLNNDGKKNILAVRLENKPQSSRWYPGAGLYRNVHIITTSKTHIPIWGTYITTPEVSKERASVNLIIEVENGKKISIQTTIRDANGRKVAYSNEESNSLLKGISVYKQNFIIKEPKLWSPETPSLYYAETKVFKDNKYVDKFVTRFGIRSIEIIPQKGFFLNGERRKFKGVCNHHDLGPLGAAVNEAAIRRQLTLLKDMGCDAIRTSHNMPAPELVKLCDEMGFMMMVESFDEWDIAKCTNGYHLFFEEWAEKDMVNMIRHYKNNPCVVMWSIGNEVPTQCSDQGYNVASFLQKICHREDPTRPVTCGMDQVQCVVENGFAAIMDVVGLNYRTFRYREAYDNLPQKIVLGSETASTVSSRGVYKFPVKPKAGAIYNDNQSSSYDVEYCYWSNLPDVDFAIADDYDWALGQFVWTGFDYLGEPTPYDTDAWPNHSSMFGIIDLAYIPKDRFYLYRSIWNKDKNTLHILPHWNWEGREGKNIPIFVYTNYDSAELFVNGVSQGVRRKDINKAETSIFKDEFEVKSLLKRYRLMWDDVVYQPGELRVVAYDYKGKVAEEKIVRTAGEPHHIELSVDKNQIKSDGKDLAYINIKIVDKNGNLCPNDARLVIFRVKGEGKFRATANGNPTSLDPFYIPQMHAFSGQLTAIVQSGNVKGHIRFLAEAEGVKGSSISIGIK
jgi:beta-galactosidase